MYCNHHPSDEEICAVLDCELGGQEADRVAGHIRSCEQCASRTRVLLPAGAELSDERVFERLQGPDCPSREQLRKHHAGRLKPDISAQVEAHAESCQLCHHILVMLDIAAGRFVEAVEAV